MKFLIALAMMLASFSAFSGGSTNAAVPTRIDLVQAGSAGFMMSGNFGNPAACSGANLVFVEIAHPQYSQIYSAVLSALMGGKKITVYIHSCKPVPWYSSDSVTYNTMGAAGAISIEG